MNEPPVKIDCLGSGKFCHNGHFGLVQFHAFLVDSVPQEQDFWYMKLAFLPLDIIGIQGNGIEPS